VVGAIFSNKGAKMKRLIFSLLAATTLLGTRAAFAADDHPGAGDAAHDRNDDRNRNRVGREDNDRNDDRGRDRGNDHDRNDDRNHDRAERGGRHR
jgi:hypothetical protein